jgi:hypothetical protein
VQPDRLGHLLADLLGRIQRRLRVLEDHRDRVAAQLAQLGIGEAHELVPLELDRSCDDLPAVREQSEDRQSEHRLAAARLAHQAQGLAAVGAMSTLPTACTVERVSLICV